MTPYQHWLTGFFVKQEEAQAACAELIHRGIPAQQLRLYLNDPEDQTPTTSGDSQQVLTNFLVDRDMSASSGWAGGAEGDIPLGGTQVTLFVASPLIAPLAMLGWCPSLSAAVSGAIRFNKKDGRLAELVSDAIQSGQAALMVSTCSEAQTSVAIEVIQSAVGTYQDEARR